MFADSLPDGWGRFLVDRLMLKNRIEPAAVGTLNRLAIVGDFGMGALSYRPAIHLNESVPVLRMFRLMCFNVFAHNRDDHSKNFSYLYDEQDACYRLAPAYDLTYSSSLNGEHATTVGGNGVNPGMEDILAVAEQIGIGRAQTGKIAREVRDCVKEMLAAYLI